MFISEVENILVEIPLRRRVLLSTTAYAAREFNVVRIRTDEGLTGIGYSRGGRLVHSAIEYEVKPLVMGKDPLAATLFWEEAYRSTIAVGRRGAVMKALSAVDIALWDIKAKAAGLPLFRFLGGGDPEVPAYVSGGYYRDGQTLEELTGEMIKYAERGFRAMKMRVGRLPWREDVTRVAAVREAVGDDVDLMVDANNGYLTPADAIRAGQAFGEYGIRWLEEPVHPDDLAGSARVAAALDVPIATGEQESTRWAFRALIDGRAADILQPDVTVVGGVSEWLRVAALASASGLPVAPHYFPEVHAHLAVAHPNTMYVEYFYPDADIISFDELLVAPIKPRDGRLRASERPGVGLDLKEDAVAKYRVM